MLVFPSLQQEKRRGITGGVTGNLCWDNCWKVLNGIEGAGISLGGGAGTSGETSQGIKAGISREGQQEIRTNQAGPGVINPI